MATVIILQCAKTNVAKIAAGSSLTKRHHKVEHSSHMKGVTLLRSGSEWPFDQV